MEVRDTIGLFSCCDYKHVKKLQQNTFLCFDLLLYSGLQIKILFPSHARDVEFTRFDLTVIFAKKIASHFVGSYF